MDKKCRVSVDELAHDGGGDQVTNNVHQKVREYLESIDLNPEVGVRCIEAVTESDEGLELIQEFIIDSVRAGPVAFGLAKRVNELVERDIAEDYM